MSPAVGRWRTSDYARAARTADGAVTPKQPRTVPGTALGQAPLVEKPASGAAYPQHAMPPEFDARAATLVHGVGQREAHPMGGADDREDDENVAGEALRGRPPAAPTQPCERNRQNFRNGRGGPRELARGAAGTEESLAATLPALGDRARLENRLDDAR